MLDCPYLIRVAWAAFEQSFYRWIFSNLSSIEILLRAIFAALIYPGFLFLLILGGLTEGLRRQFAARVEGRDAPPLGQPFYDIRKLSRRATAVPAGNIPPEDDTQAQQMAGTRREGNRLALYTIPVFGLLTLIAGVVLVPLPGNLWPFLSNNNTPLGADLLAVVLLLLVPAIGAIVMSSLGGSVYGQLAGSRNFQLVVVSAVPYAVAVFGPALARGSLDFRTVAGADSPALLGVKALTGLLFLLCLPALLRLRPLAVSRGEALEGVTNDLSGAPLALFALMQWIERLAFSLLFASLFVPFAHVNPLFFVGGVALSLGLIGIVDVLFSQVRLKDSLNFYLRYANPSALALFIIVTLAIKP